MEFAYPIAFGLLLLAVPLLLLAARRRPAAVPLVTLQGLAAARPTLRLRLLWLPLVLRLGACSLLVVAIARPREGSAETVVPAEGVDIVLTLDVSGSMATTPISGGNSRLEASVAVMREFIDARVDDRLGLVVFAEYAIPVVPPTLDHDALASIVATVEEDYHPGNQTAIGLAIGESVRLLQSSPAASRVVILLTDGDENVDAISPEAAAELARNSGIRIYTIAILNPNAPFGGIDQAVMTAVAERTGGIFFPVESSEELAEVYEEISTLETSGVERDRFIQYSEYGPWFALAAAALFVADTLLRATWLRRTGL
jgi:Ca-activated chloride channel family protein